MKNALISCLMILCLLCSACAQLQTTPPSETSTLPQENESSPITDPSMPEPESQAPVVIPSVTPLLEDYLSELNILETPAREYGESTSFIQMGEDLVVHVLYPEGDLPELDQAVEAWVSDIVTYYETEASNSSVNGDADERLVDYCSYFVSQEYASVKLTGFFDRPYLAHPIDIFASFNVNLETGKLLSLSDILLLGAHETLRDQVAADAGVEAELVDDGLLDHWLLTKEGLEITLVRGEYLPMSDGTRTLLYSFDDLQGILAPPESTEQELPPPEDPQTEENPEAPEGLPPSPSIDPSKPMLALTFDDGPSAHTERLLDAFAAHGGKGTFYVVGNMISNRPDTLKRMSEEGHEIGGHSWDHRQLTKLSTEDLTDQIMNTRAKIYDITGLDAVTMRPPYGSYNDQVKEVCKELGIVMVNWSVDTLDWKYKDADTVYNAVMKDAKDGAIILCHDLHKTTVAAMERAIPDLIAQGYQLVTVSELLSCSEKTITPGSVYFKR